MNIYFVYRDVCKHHEAIFSMRAQTKNEIEPHARYKGLQTRKLNKKSSDYATLAVCFHIVDDITDLNDSARKRKCDVDITRGLIGREMMRNPPPFPRQNDIKALKDKLALPKPNALVIPHRIIDHIEELIDQGNCWEFVRDKARKKRDQGKSDQYELTDEEKDRRPAKKPTLSINCVFEGHNQLAPESKKTRNRTHKRETLTTMR
ncbi:hypothetical protein DVH24_003876 [Malus domestica]|uniref:Uncharacterized protein n=1 Tax=Malus domestica TaxID=3750 RepID=A0A498KA52_MALDO|nr:hypothetical protein DVH24_003876 [Malus domestica]